MTSVLVVDDDRSILVMVARALKPLELEVLTAGTAEEALAAIRAHQPDTVLLDIMLPGTSGLEILHEIQAIDRKLPVILITSGAGSETAIEAMQLGAYEYVPKPLDLPSLADTVRKALDSRRMMKVPVAVATEVVSDDPVQLFVGRSPQMLEVFKAVGRVAQQNVTVLVRGESGTGKELVARALYQHSDRRNETFMAVNCAALPDTLLESELFGHEKGSFTSADRRRVGKFEQCNGGTIFLDEVGDMAPVTQSKVLRLLQDQRFERVGGNETIQTDVRIIAATNRNLEAMVEKGEFRADLLYRLNGMTIFLPPLRERPDDISRLLQYFLSRAVRDLRKPHIEGIAPEALEILMNYEWPGNVRELQSVVRQSVLTATGPVIIPEFLPREVRNERPRASAPVGGAATATKAPDGMPDADLVGFIESRLAANTTEMYAETLEMMERYLFTRVLQVTEGNQSRAAEILGITRGKIRDRIAAFNISFGRDVRIDEASPAENS